MRANAWDQAIPGILPDRPQRRLALFGGRSGLASRTILGGTFPLTKCYNLSELARNAPESGRLRAKFLPHLVRISPRFRGRSVKCDGFAPFARVESNQAGVYVRPIVQTGRLSVANHLYKGDLPDDLDLGPVVAIDCETMGLNPHRDRLCVVQLSSGDGHAHLVQIAKGQTAAPNLCRLLADPQVLKLFHYGRFDIAAMYQTFGTLAAPVWCTKIASRLVRTYTDRHGLRSLVQELLGTDISKQQQSSDWGADTLTDAQLSYAASDVLHLHRLRDALTEMLEREDRSDLAQACFDFLPTRARLDLSGWAETDIFAHG